MKNINKKILLLSFLQLIFTCMFFNDIFDYDFVYNIVSILLLYLYYKVNINIFKAMDNRRKKIAIFFISIIFSIAVFVGLSLTYNNGFTNIFNISKLLFVSVLNFPIFAILFKKLFDIIDDYNIDINKHVETKRFLVKTFFVVLLLWVPILLAYYPGIFDYDVDTQLYYMLNDSYSTHHPLIHTLILGFFYKIGESLNNYNIGILLYTIVQMIIGALVISYSILYIKKKNFSNKFIFVIICFYALLPINSIMMISATKDVYFSIFVLGFVTLLLEFRDENWKLSKKYIIFSIITILMLLFRCNAIYALIIALFIIVILDIKKYKNLIIILIISMMSFAIIECGLEKSLNADTRNERDMLSIPLQQLASVGNNSENELTKKEYLEISYYVKSTEYNKYLSDPIKNSTDMDKIKDDYIKFIQTWFKYLVKFPTVYLESFLYNTQGFWDINDISHSKIYGINKDVRNGYILTGTKDGYGVEHVSYCKPIENLFEWLFTLNNYQKIPIIGLLFSPALYIWSVIFYLIYSIYKKDKDSILISAFFIGLIITLLVGPTCLIRYVYPFVLCIPLLITDLLIKNNINKDKVI